MFDFDFGLLENEDVKEDSVREFVVAPLLQFSKNGIQANKK